MKNNSEYPVCKQRPEILAPAGDMTALIGAIKGGADAVYLGVGEFNARQGASNFSEKQLEDAIELAHSYGLSIYLALNIPIKQNELQEALDLVDDAYAMGIDAIIMRDIGLISHVHTLYPDLPIHASTQMTVHNTAGVKSLEELGVKRAIVARELNTSELDAIVHNSNIGIEIFVHGALCYSYSGQCLFSSFTTGRSANRGACAQPCRWKFDLVIDGKKCNQEIGGSYPISCAELCTLGDIGDIVKTGICSLKIEGRMKKSGYVTAASSAYREAVEKVCSGIPLDEKWAKQKEEELGRLFYRGFTKGFVLEDRDVTNPAYSSSHGVLLGTVQNLVFTESSASLKLTLEHDLEMGDGISILTKHRMLGSSIGAIMKGSKEILSAKRGETVSLLISPRTGKAVEKGDEVYVTTDSSLLKQLQAVELPKFPVDIVVDAHLDRELSISVSEGHSQIEHVSDYVVHPSRKAPTGEEQISSIMERLGDTPYSVSSITINADDNIFIPLGVLTQARRDAFDALLENKLSAFQKEAKYPFFDTEKSDSHEVSDSLLLAVEVGSIDALLAALENGADIIHVPISLFPEIQQFEVGRLLESNNGVPEIILSLPPIIHDSEQESVIQLLLEAKKYGFSVECSDLGSLKLAEDLGLSFVASKSLNTFNSLSVTTLSQKGAFRVDVSPELSVKEIRELSSGVDHGAVQLESVAYGRQLMFVTEHDLLAPLVKQGFYRNGVSAYLVDKKGDRYPIRRWGTRTLLYDSRVINMSGKLRDLQEAGISVIRLELGSDGQKKVANLVTTYREALDRLSSATSSGSTQHFTGHYFEEV
ncbi:putative protease [Methanohalophilus levihalophilus]|uniref:DUF3656 domain-containing U32 family peptidase n=1 Tax=Methanohalophilus levihalophilus TaxID=1431282 RepID=UPI001AE2BB7A|nr:U32 family peptidase [Methanohalophilus levihalophilus]MBP2029474.1 putative protease [Methanohalophilus levihalophilus]